MDVQKVENKECYKVGNDSVKFSEIKQMEEKTPVLLQSKDIIAKAPKALSLKTVRDKSVHTGIVTEKKLKSSVDANIVHRQMKRPVEPIYKANQMNLEEFSPTKVSTECRLKDLFCNGNGDK